MEIREFLLRHLVPEALGSFGERDRAYLERIADDWLDDTAGTNASRYRIGRIRSHLPCALRILDLGAGCGTFVHRALADGLDAFGLEPEPWKLEVARRKALQDGDEPAWSRRMIAGFGEFLPFADDSFDCVTSYQTLEHVRDLAACCAEMFRVTRPGGGIYIRCPDYAISTFEGHYRLPWLPGLWGKPAERYLAFCRRPARGLGTLLPVSARLLRRIFAELGEKSGASLRVVDVNSRRIRELLRIPSGVPSFPLTGAATVVRFMRLLFRGDYPAHLFVHVEGK